MAFVKNNFKRYLAGILAAAMIFCAGCSEEADKTTSASKKESTSAVTTTTADDDPQNPANTSAPDDGDDNILTPDEDKPASDITPALWKIKTESGAVIYMMGSMHALPDNAYPFPEAIMNAYSSSDAIAVECDTVAFASDLSKQFELTEKMLYTDGTTIKDHIGEELYTKLVEKLNGWGAYISAYDYYVPAMWQSIFENCLLDYSELDYDNSFDEYFLKLAKEDEKEIIEVESVESQYDMLTSFSDEINILILESYAEYTEEEYCEEIKTMYEYWASGDIEALVEMNEIDESLFTQEELAAYEEYNNRLITERNKVMADKLIELSKGDKNVFYYVGAAHFGGEDGILSLLDKAGVEYERVEY